MKYSIDLHIHSALSPCASCDMTPNNIVNMAYIKKLDIISVTDHNTMENLKSIIELGNRKNILVIPGIEVTTKEEVHVLCFFQNLECGLQFSREIYESLPNIRNEESIFGEQLIFNENDEVIGKLDNLLLSRSGYSIEDVYDMTCFFNGVMVPAHVDRMSYSILSVLGFIPRHLAIGTLEVSPYADLEKLKKIIKLENYNIINNSDAHDLYTISEPVNFIKLDRLSLENVIRYLKREKGYYI